MDTFRLYLEAPKGVLDHATVAATFRKLLEFTDDVQIDSDEHGSFIQVPAEAGEKFLASLKTEDASQAPVARKRGRPRKVQE
jgi:hypothetical protein